MRKEKPEIENLIRIYAKMGFNEKQLKGDKIGT